MAARTSPLLGTTSPLVYTSAVDFSQAGLGMRLPLAGAAMVAAVAVNTAAPPISATTVAKALTVVQPSPVPPTTAGTGACRP